MTARRWITAPLGDTRRGIAAMGKHEEKDDSGGAWWKQTGAMLAVFVGFGTVGGFILSPIVVDAREKAQLRADVDQLKKDREQDRQDAAADRKLSAERNEAIIARFTATDKEVSAMRFDMNTVRGKMDLLLERMLRR